ncbi:uncharacterized protein B0H18DRAFT_1153581 [Fomitopsis serialis]|uniref:uncharacterized protein n=1 Tax=Fomitopsis serialis TaxID=139415 RepID=UPI0020087CF6|nr:uncharacterized protein B0H18DRAFT_1153581 [Neoantrodia serialis]KAH9929481.1 hypothetical protein B0H18DRAFT_1153581 [Neoantrodia serialis]
MARDGACRPSRSPGLTARSWTKLCSLRDAVRPSPGSLAPRVRPLPIMHSARRRQNGPDRHGRQTTSRKAAAREPTREKRDRNRPPMTPTLVRNQGYSPKSRRCQRRDRMYTHVPDLNAGDHPWYSNLAERGAILPRYPISWDAPHAASSSARHYGWSLYNTCITVDSIDANGIERHCNLSNRWSWQHIPYGTVARSDLACDVRFLRSGSNYSGRVPCPFQQPYSCATSVGACGSATICMMERPSLIAEIERPAIRHYMARRAEWARSQQLAKCCSVPGLIRIGPAWMGGADMSGCRRADSSVAAGPARRGRRWISTQVLNVRRSGVQACYPTTAARGRGVAAVEKDATPKSIENPFRAGRGNLES